MVLVPEMVPGMVAVEVPNRVPSLDRMMDLVKATEVPGDTRAVAVSPKDTKEMVRTPRHTRDLVVALETVLETVLEMVLGMVAERDLAKDLDLVLTMDTACLPRMRDTVDTLEATEVPRDIRAAVLDRKDIRVRDLNL